MENTKIDIVKTFSEWLEQQGKATATIKTYVGVIEKFQCWLDEMDKGLNEISKKDVQLYMDYLESQKKNPGTIEKYLMAISVFSQFLGKSQIVLDIQRKEKIKEKDIPDSLGESEQKQLLADIKVDGNIRNIAIVYTLLYTGIRISELCALNHNDIKIENEQSRLYVRDKDGNIERIIPLSKAVSECLKVYIDSLAIKGEPLFVSNANKRLSTRAVQYMLQKYNVNPHKLRHTFCQKLINKGIDINTVAKLAGHKDVNVTKRYTAYLEVHLESAITQAFS